MLYLLFVFYFRLLAAIGVAFIAGSFWVFGSPTKDAGHILAVIFIIGAILIAPPIDIVRQLGKDE